MQPSPPSISRTFSSPKWNSVPIKQQLPLPLSPRNHHLTFCFYGFNWSILSLWLQLGNPGLPPEALLPSLGWCECPDVKAGSRLCSSVDTNLTYGSCIWSCHGFWSTSHRLCVHAPRPWQSTGLSVLRHASPAEVQTHTLSAPRAPLWGLGSGFLDHHCLSEGTWVFPRLAQTPWVTHGRFRVIPLCPLNSFFLYQESIPNSLSSEFQPGVR